MGENMIENVKTQGHMKGGDRSVIGSNQNMDPKMVENENGNAQGHSRIENESEISSNQVFNNEDDNMSTPDEVMPDDKADIATNKNTLLNDYNEINDTNLNENEQSTVENLIDWTRMLNECQDDEPASVFYEGTGQADSELTLPLFNTEGKNNYKERDYLDNQMQCKDDNAKGGVHGLNSAEKVDKLQIAQNVPLFDEHEPPVIVVTEEKLKSNETTVSITPDRKFKEMIIVKKVEDGGWIRSEDEGRHISYNEREIYECKLCNVRFKLYDTIIMHLEHFHDVTDSEAESMS